MPAHVPASNLSCPASSLALSPSTSTWACARLMPHIPSSSLRAREHILLGGVSVNERPDLHLVDPSGRRIEACPPLGAAGSLPRPEHCYATNHHKHDNDENDDDATAYAACVASAPGCSRFLLPVSSLGPPHMHVTCESRTVRVPCSSVLYGYELKDETKSAINGKGQ